MIDSLSSDGMVSPATAEHSPGLPVAIDGELDMTTEIPLVPLLPPVPPAARPADPGDVDVWRYGWLFGLALAVVLVLGYPLGQLLLSWSQR